MVIYEVGINIGVDTIRSIICKTEIIAEREEKKFRAELITELKYLIEEYKEAGLLSDSLEFEKDLDDLVNNRSSCTEERTFICEIDVLEE